MTTSHVNIRNVRSYRLQIATASLKESGNTESTSKESGDWCWHRARAGSDGWAGIAWDWCGTSAGCVDWDDASGCNALWLAVNVLAADRWCWCGRCALWLAVDVLAADWCCWSRCWGLDLAVGDLSDGCWCWHRCRCLDLTVGDLSDGCWGRRSCLDLTVGDLADWRA